jgi:predicted RNA-binding protein YlqC (UPF0109 family)
MAGQQFDAAGLVRVLVEPIVEYPDELEITESVNEHGDILVEIDVNEDDAGKVIGRQGRVIKSIRTLVRAAASRVDARVEVELIDR